MNKKLGIAIVSLFGVLAVLYALMYFAINPPFFISLINDQQIKSQAYERDIILTIVPEQQDDEIPDMSIVIKESVNTRFSEAYQHIDMSWDELNFQWEKLYKFDTLIIKTPYDGRNIGIYNFKDSGYSYDFSRNQSTILSIVNSAMKENIFFSKAKYNEKLARVSKAGVGITYNIDLTQDDFNKISEYIWSSPEFASFFKEDDAIQAKLGIPNETKALIDMFYDFKNNAKATNATMTIDIGLSGTNSAIFAFDFEYNDKKLAVTLSEYIKNIDEDVSPESFMDIVSITDINELKKSAN